MPVSSKGPRWSRSDCVDAKASSWPPSKAAARRSADGWSRISVMNKSGLSEARSCPAMPMRTLGGTDSSGTAEPQTARNLISILGTGLTAVKGGLMEHAEWLQGCDANGSRTPVWANWQRRGSGLAREQQTGDGSREPTLVFARGPSAPVHEPVVVVGRHQEPHHVDGVVVAEASAQRSLAGEDLEPEPGTG